MPVVPVVGMLFSVWLITSLRPATWLRFVVWLGLGMIIYFAYGRRRSLLLPASGRSLIRRPPHP
jgi:APA family basic amino acid/polyamine antiporter